MAREGEFFFQNIDFIRGLRSGLRFRDRRSWTRPAGAQDPNRQARRCRRRRRRGFAWRVEWRRQSSGGQSPEKLFRPARSRAPPPAPSRCYSLCERRPYRNGRGKIILYISFQRGAMVASGDRPSPVSVATSVGPGRAPPGRRTRGGSRDRSPLWNPHGEENEWGKFAFW